jgi:hypothetical protein
MPTTPQTVPKSDNKDNCLCASNGKALLRQTRRQEDSPVMLSEAKVQRSEASRRPAKLLFKRTGSLWLKGQYISDRKMRYSLRRSKNVSFSWEKGV